MVQLFKRFHERIEITSAILKIALTVSLTAPLAAQGIVPDPAPISHEPEVTIQVDLTKTVGVYKPIYRWFGYDEANFTTMPHGKMCIRDRTNIKVSSVEGFIAGQKILIDSGANLEDAIIAAVGTAGATTIRTATGVGDTVLHAENVTGFSKGQRLSLIHI